VPARPTDRQHSPLSLRLTASRWPSFRPPQHPPSPFALTVLGIGDEASLRAAVTFGVDTFDSAYPTRLGRHGTLLTRREGRLKIGKARFRDDYRPADPECDGFVSKNYSRAYLHHLWRANEPVVHGLLTLHNIKFMADLMAELRAAIWRNEI
jgi:queuine tRNA-ribosyltransferase